MATVQVFTAARTQEIEDQAIVGAAVVGDDLIMTRHNGDTLNAGVVKGATGDAGPVGETITPGIVAMWLWPTLPTGWLSIEGQSIANANTLHPGLWTSPYIPSDWKAGTTLTFPNMRGRIPVHQDAAQTEFDTLLETGGAKTVSLTAANLPPHQHANDHDHVAFGGSTNNDTHQHDVTKESNIGGGGIEQIKSADGVIQTWFAWGLSSYGSTTSPKFITTQNTHSHGFTIDVPPYSGVTGNGAAQGLNGTAVNNLQPYIVVRYIIKT